MPPATFFSSSSLSSPLLSSPTSLARASKSSLEISRLQGFREVFVSLNPFENALQHGDFRDFLFRKRQKNLPVTDLWFILGHYPFSLP
jgi:hypothetical protein